VTKFFTFSSSPCYLHFLLDQLRRRLSPSPSSSSSFLPSVSSPLSCSTSTYSYPSHLFLSYFSFFVFLSLRHTLVTVTYLLLTFYYCSALFCPTATDLSQLSLAWKMSARIPFYLRTSTKSGVCKFILTFWRSFNIVSLCFTFECNQFLCKSRITSPVRSRRWPWSSRKPN
jgi:hypothetical protein